MAPVNGFRNLTRYKCYDDDDDDDDDDDAAVWESQNENNFASKIWYSSPPPSSPIETPCSLVCKSTLVLMLTVTVLPYLAP